MQDVNYRTTRSKKIGNALLRNMLMSAVGAAFLTYSWMQDGGLAFLSGAVLCSAILVFSLLVFKATATPLEIKDDAVVISSLFSTSVPLANIKGIGQHPTRNTPSLTYADPDKGHNGELVLPWKFIAEPEAEVVAKLKAAMSADRV